MTTPFGQDPNQPWKRPEGGAGPYPPVSEWPEGSRNHPDEQAQFALDQPVPYPNGYEQHYHAYGQPAARPPRYPSNQQPPSGHRPPAWDHYQDTDRAAAGSSRDHYQHRPHGYADPQQAYWPQSPGAFDSDKSRQQTPVKRTWAWLLSHPGWAGVGGVVGIIALVLASIQFISGPDSGTTPTAMGNCSANGTNIDIDCSQITNLPKPQSIAELGLDVSWEGYTTWYFDGPRDELPEPPAYPEDKKNGHCEDWAEYLSSNPKFSAMGPAVLLTAASGIHDQVAISNVRVNVFEHREISATSTSRSFVECLHGAGLNAGYYVSVDTRTNETLVSSGGAESDISNAPMPPASIVITDNEFSSVLIRINGDPGTLYEGQIVVTATVNGEERAVELGNLAAPIRWVGNDPTGDSATLPTSSDDVVDWDLSSQTWVPTR